MSRLALWTGLILIGLGLVGYFASGQASKTALIPAAFGLPIAILGLVGRKPTARRHAMHGAVLLAVLGLAGSIRGLPKLFPLIAGEEVKRPGAVVSQSIMAVLCLLFVVLAVRSFIAARRNPEPPR